MHKFFTGATAFMISISGMAQDNDSTEKKNGASPFTIGGYVEVYYSYDFNKPSNNDKAFFLYSHDRHNEVNVNLAFLKGTYATERVRANLSIGTGTYMNANYASEPDVLKSIYEANAGIKLSKKKNLWLDAGILPSHIGFESAVSKDCWDVTRSIAAENSPYFETGAKLTYTTDNGKWLFSVLALNGWQRIRRLEGNSLMSFGTQVQYKPSDAFSINYSTFAGTDKPDSTRQMRYFHNLYAIITIGRLGLLPSFDIGMEQKAKGSSQYNIWYTPVLRTRYRLSDKWTIAARAEYYNDAKGVIISTGTPHGFKTYGYAFNIDYAPVSNALVRLEARTLHSKDEIFVKGSGTGTNNNSFITGSIAISF